MGVSVPLIRSLSSTFGVEVGGVSLTDELGGGADATLVDELRRLWLEHKLVLFRDQLLTADEQLRFAGWFGPAEGSTPQAMQAGETMSTPVHYISNRLEGGRAGDGELVFHSDSASPRAHPGRRAPRHRGPRRGR